MLFLSEKDHARCRAPLLEAMRRKLPSRFRGYPANFASPDADNVRVPEKAGPGPIHHRVEILTVSGFFQDCLNFDVSQDIEPMDWLTFPEQTLCAITAGAIYHDGIGFQSVRDRFSYYPTDVWLYLLAAGWTRIGQEEHLMGRAGMVGDEIGSAIIGARLVRDVMRLCFLMEKRYAPYSKWFGTAFRQLACAQELSPILRCVQLSQTWQEREKYLSAAFEYAATMHNALNITEHVPAKVSQFFDRPFLVVSGERFAEAIRVRITDAKVKRIASRRLIGSVDQFSDSADILSDACWRMQLRSLYD